MSKMNPDTLCGTQINALEVYLRLHDALSHDEDKEVVTAISSWIIEVSKNIQDSERRPVSEILGWNKGMMSTEETP